MTNCIEDLFRTGMRTSQSAAEQVQLQTDIEANSCSSPLTQTLLSSLEGLSTVDLGVTPAYFVPGVITYVTIYDSPEFWMGFFCMSAGTRFPLHDHPGMTGISRLVSGRIHFRGLNGRRRDAAGRLIAEVSAEYELVGCGSEMLTPKVRNIHEISAVEDSVLLDFFVPYYNSARKCTFFTETASLQDSAILQETSPPLIPCRVKTYRGVSFH